MDKTTTLNKLRKLVAGKDPHDGAPLMGESILHRPDVCDILQQAVGAVEQLINTEERQRWLPANTGKPWSNDEEARVLERFDRGVQINQIAKEFQRTIGGIKARLVKCGRLEEESHKNTQRITRSSQYHE